MLDHPVQHLKVNKAIRGFRGEGDLEVGGLPTNLKASSPFLLTGDVAFQ